MDQQLLKRKAAQLAALETALQQQYADTAAAVADLVKMTATTLKVDRAAIWLVEKDTQLVIRAQWPGVKKGAIADYSLQREEYADYLSELGNASQSTHEYRQRPALMREFLDSCYGGQPVISMLDLPVCLSDQPVGVIGVDSLAERHWAEDEVQFVSAVAALIALSLETADRRAADRRLVQQQRELQTVLDSMVEGIITVDDKGNIVSHNVAAEHILGYGPGELMAVALSDISPVIANSEQRDNLLEVIIAAGVTISDATQEQQARRKDGSLIPIRLSIAELPLGPDGHQRYVGSILDITVEKQQQERLRRSDALESLSHLSGGIAHDFNNMLGVVLGYAELIRNSCLEVGDDETLAKVEKIIHAGRRGSDLTRRLLAFSRRSPGSAKSIDVNSFLHSSAQLLGQTLTPRIELTLNCQPDCWPVNVDPGELEDAMMNLAVNAMRAIDQSGTLELRSENSRITRRRARTLDIQAGEYVKISAIDDGVGMDKATLERVFEPFFTSRPGEGSGLGLSQVYGFTQRVNGGVQIVSKPGKGTTVELYIPRHHTAGENSSEDFSSGEQPIIENPGRSVLVVDDEPALRQLVETVLTGAGFEVTVAVDGEQALALSEEKQFDLVLSDVIMPVMDGYQLTEALLKKRPNQSIRLMTGYDQSARLRGGYDTPVALRKPFTTVELLEVVNEALSTK
ncbi:MAG: response regulator [Gammaproteobacteria bacterium]